MELRNRHDRLVRRDLKHAVGRRVHDQRAGPHVFGPELVDDPRAGRRSVPQHAASGPARKHRDDVAGKSVRERRERAIEDDAHHLPMPGDRVLARRRFRHAADRGWGDRGMMRDRCANRRDAIEPEAAQRRQPQRDPLRDVADSIAAAIAVRRRIGKLTHAHAVEDDHDGAGVESTGRGHARTHLINAWKDHGRSRLTTKVTKYTKNTKKTSNRRERKARRSTRATAAGTAGRERNLKRLANANHLPTLLFVFASCFSFRGPLRGQSRAWSLSCLSWIFVFSWFRSSSLRALRLNAGNVCRVTATTGARSSWSPAWAS